ncbi:topoisomerase DNA-binding C4 zinc finger domain-containing protein [Legionella geestiana]|uniref:topoisomerase DNA-binding C4 zinc finger domain-containing protein n=1 Tax=Legionella geestiana TaxID=45065 RepID=UPI001FEAD55F|nr:topoisomerase DNA-binding C4 zinc finger domain-containing protein [Legionella geestiana]
MLRDIEKNPQTLDGFIERQVAFVTEQVARANNGVVTITGAKASAVVSDNYRCTECQKGLVRRPGRKGFWWSCSSYPECRQTLARH